RLARRPEEEDDSDGKLRDEQHIGQYPVGEGGPFFGHVMALRAAEGPDVAIRTLTLRRSRLLVGGFELAQDLVAALYGAVESLTRRLLTGKNCLELAVDHVAHLAQIAKADALRIGSRGAARDLQDGDVGAGVLGVVTLVLAKVVG